MCVLDTVSVLCSGWVLGNCKEWAGPSRICFFRKSMLLTFKTSSDAQELPFPSRNFKSSLAACSACISISELSLYDYTTCLRRRSWNPNSWHRQNQSRWYALLTCRLQNQWRKSSVWDGDFLLEARKQPGCAQESTRGTSEIPIVSVPPAKILSQPLRVKIQRFSVKLVRKPAWVPTFGSQWWIAPSSILCLQYR